MGIFLSKIINKVDKKGRVTIPSTYRNILNSEDFSGIIVYPSIKNECIEACSMSRLVELSIIIQNLDPYSDERDAFETIVLGGSVQLPFDNEGRVILPQTLLDDAGISSQACFVGKGLVFEIWEPSKFDKHQEVSRDIATKNRAILKNVNA